MTGDFFKKFADESGGIVGRSLLSALFLTAVTAAMLVAPNFSGLFKPDTLGLLPIIVLLAIPFAHGSYEVLLPFHRRISHKPILTEFRRVTKGKCDNKHIDYEFLRAWRTKYFDNPTSKHLEEELFRNLTFRRNLTYLFSNCWLALIITGVIGVMFDDKYSAMRGTIGICLALSLITAVAHWNRSCSLGRAYGYAYLDWFKKHPEES